MFYPNMFGNLVHEPAPQNLASVVCWVHKGPIAIVCEMCKNQADLYTWYRDNWCCPRCADGHDPLERRETFL